MKKFFGLTILALTFLAFLGVVPANAADAPAAPAIAAAAQAQPGCQPVLDLGKALKSQGEACSTAPLTRTKTPEPEFLIGGTGGRTCRCSCGYPCTSDADCGGAVGSCRSGITCC